MKKALAVLLAVLMAFSACVVCASAEGDGGAATGTTYKYADNPGRITVNTGTDVVILQAGDVLEFGAVTAKTSDTKYRTIEVIYYPDAASIKTGKTGPIKNVNWSDEVVPKYNLDSEKWKLDKGQTAADLMAKSPNYFKTFYTQANFYKDDVASATFVGLNDLAHARDSAGVDRGDLENGNPIDFALPGTKFLGWALYSYGTWRPKDTGVLRVEVYALWERGAAPEEKPDEPDKPDEPQEPTEYATPIQATLAKWLAKIAEIFSYAKLAGAVPGMLGEVLSGAVRKWLYGVFGIEA